MILHLDRHAFVVGIERGPLRYCPGFQHSIELEAEVVVQTPRGVLLHHEEQRPVALAGLFGRRFGGAREGALGGIAVEGAGTHSSPSSHSHSASSIELRTCASVRPLRAGTWNA